MHGFKLIFGMLLGVLSLQAQDLLRQSEEAMNRKGEGCQSAKCHVGIEPMHASSAVHLGCTDCHGGNATSTEKKAGTRCLEISCNVAIKR